MSFIDARLYIMQHTTNRICICICVERVEEFVCLKCISYISKLSESTVSMHIRIQLCNHVCTFSCYAEFNITDTQVLKWEEHRNLNQFFVVFIHLLCSFDDRSISMDKHLQKRRYYKNISIAFVKSVLQCAANWIVLTVQTCVGY